MNYYVCGNIAGNKYRVEARRNGTDSELIGIYDGYYNYRHHTFSLYIKVLGGSAQPWDVPKKIKISAYEVKKIKASRSDETKTVLAPAALSQSQERTMPRKRVPRDVEGQIKIL